MCLCHCSRAAVRLILPWLESGLNLLYLNAETGDGREAARSLRARNLAGAPPRGITSSHWLQQILERFVEGDFILKLESSGAVYRGVAVGRGHIPVGMQAGAHIAPEIFEDSEHLCTSGFDRARMIVPVHHLTYEIRTVRFTVAHERQIGREGYLDAVAYQQSPGILLEEIERLLW